MSDLAEAGTQPKAGAVVEIASGRVQGLIENGVHTFKGVPYGADTAARRFMAPLPAQPWSGVREAFAYGPRAPQPPRSPHPLTRSMADRGAPVSEDCLVANIWTPAPDAAKRPVMVWMHGGAFGAGSGSSNAYDGAHLARKGDVVVVTLNHRIGPFGWLYLAPMGDETFADSGMVGMLDLVLALEWVRDNIAAFGGDPGNVTIFGESGGGAKVSLLLGMPAAQGLYHKAIIQSGAYLAAAPPAKGEATARGFLADMGLGPGRLDELRRAPMRDILKVLGDASTLAKRMAHMPTTDGRNLPRDPFEPDATPLSANIPLLIGNNGFEYVYQFGQDDPTNFELTWEALPARLAAATAALGIPGEAAATIARYRDIYPDYKASDVLFQTLTDGRMIANSIALAERKAARGGAPIWFYRLEWETPVDGGKWRAAHFLDVPLVFGALEAGASAIGAGAVQQRLSDQMGEAWIAFARHGAPAAASLPQWRTYEPASRSTMIFDEACRMVDDPSSETRRYWSQTRARA